MRGSNSEKKGEARDSMEERKPIRVLIAKPGLDGHDL